MNRRTILSAVAGAGSLVTLAGCTGRDDGDEDDGAVPDGPLDDDPDDGGSDESTDDGGSDESTDDGTSDDDDDEMAYAAVDISGDGTDEVSIQVADAGNADQLVVIDDSGTAVGDGVDAHAGDSFTQSDLGVESAGEYEVCAILGSIEAGEQVDDSASVVISFTYEG